MSKSYYNQSMRKTSVHISLFVPVQTLKTQCSYIIAIKIYESTFSIKQLYNLAKLKNEKKKWKKSTYFNFLNLDPPFNIFFGSSP